MYIIVAYKILHAKKVTQMERIPIDNWEIHEGHIYRYQLAERYIDEGEIVYDIACGIGYGSKIMTKNKKIHYVGIDKINPAHIFEQYGKFYSKNLNEFTGEGENWDVSVSFETMEHIEDPIKFSKTLKQAAKKIILSVPTIPTKHTNQYHLHNFNVDDILEIYKDWNLIHLENQPAEYSHIFVFSRLS